jgi:beta-xylosidase
MAKRIWVTDDPMAGAWREAATVRPGYNDPRLFLDDDGRLYQRFAGRWWHAATMTISRRHIFERRGGPFAIAPSRIRRLARA